MQRAGRGWGGGGGGGVCVRYNNRSVLIILCLIGIGLKLEQSITFDKRVFSGFSSVVDNAPSSLATMFQERAFEE